jgi:segregation and condensation protein B
MVELFDKDNLDEIVASILFVSGVQVEKKDIIEKLGIEKDELDAVIKRLKTKFSGKSGIYLLSFGSKLQLTSNPDYSEYITEVLQKIKEKQLTKKAMEVLAIIAYKQPITKLEINQIRGGDINSDYTIQVLIDKKLIDVVGRKEAVGLPFLYGTTDEFLKRFDLQSIQDLPSYESVLERIKVVHRENNSLYKQFDLPEESDENEAGVPEFLQDETNLKEIKSE